VFIIFIKINKIQEKYFLRNDKKKKNAAKEGGLGGGTCPQENFCVT
jgi:hypothetical protein